jgi:hypothetical protein
MNNALSGWHSDELTIADSFNLLANCVEVRCGLHLSENASSHSITILSLSLVCVCEGRIFPNELLDLNVLAMVGVCVSRAWIVVSCCTIL